MLAAIGILLIVKQAPFALGMAADLDTPVGNMPFSLSALTAFAVATVSLVLLASWETRALGRFRLVRLVPARLAVVLLGIAATLLLDMLSPSLAPPAEHRVALPELASIAALSAAIKSADLGPNFAQLLNPTSGASR
ncbi:MFS superfamily sulfate permease-like transporter [Paraburkholderia sp. WSM4179]|nr:MFS superfamily sulfate permease-like transporter [Paraburkholderia sp. WSM4179]